MRVTEAVEMMKAMGFDPAGPVHLSFDGSAHGECVRLYQEAFAGASFKEWLEPDGICGPKTLATIERWGWHLSRHFTGREFRDRREGKTIVSRHLVFGLNILRDRFGAPIRIISGYRTARSNEAVGGAKRSYHMYGLAADVSPHQDLAMVLKLRVFSGIGTYPRSGVGHVDVRHAAPEFGSGATVDRPARWSY